VLCRFTMLETILMFIYKVIIFKVGHQLPADNFNINLYVGYLQ
jgi:hypothetical protein